MLPADPAARYQTIQWVMFQMGGDRADVRPGRLLPQIRRQASARTSARCDRYVAEAKRLLGVLETRLEGRDWLMDDYTIADIATLGWVRNLIGFYEARELVDYDSLTNVPAWLERGLARPAVQRGLAIPARPLDLAADRGLQIFWKKPFEFGHSSPVSVSRNCSRISRCLRGQLGRRLDLDLDDHVAMAAAVHARHAGAALAQLLARLDAGRDLDLVHRLVEAGDLDRSRRAPRW